MESEMPHQEQVSCSQALTRGRLQREAPAAQEGDAAEFRKGNQEHAVLHCNCSFSVHDAE